MSVPRRLGMLASCLLLSGCLHADRPPATPPAHPPLEFEDAAGASGLSFRLGYDKRSPLNVVETAAGGAAFLDYDGDGRLDALLVGPHKVGLFRNAGGGHFTDVSAKSGFRSSGFWMGCAVGDYDGDGRPDVLLTGFQSAALYRNVGGRFEDVTARAGVHVPGWSLSGAFGDYDLDGRLDLYVTRYLHLKKDSPRLCRLGSMETACGPEMYDPERGLLFHNLGGGKFADATRSAGVGDSHGKGWTALFSDFNADGYPELYVADDLAPCDLFMNHRGRFTSSGAAGNVAYDGNGHLIGAMAADSGDYDNNGTLDLLVTTFFAQPTCLYENDGQALFSEVGTRSGVGAPTTQFVGFGAGFADLNNDGWLDVFIANGHVRDNIRLYDASQDYGQPMQLLLNQGGRFTNVAGTAGPSFEQRPVGRGAAFGDYDGDGRVDILLCNLNGPAMLLRNTTSSPNHWLTVRLEGAGENTQGIGARVVLKAAGREQVREIRTCGSVMSASDPCAHFGLGDQGVADEVTVHWPGGKATTLRSVKTDRVLTVRRPAP